LAFQSTATHLPKLKARLSLDSESNRSSFVFLRMTAGFNLQLGADRKIRQTEIKRT